MKNNKIFGKKLVCVSVITILFTVTFTGLALGRWTTNGPRGTSICDFVADPHDSKIVYIADGNNRILKSINGGESYFPCTIGLENAAITILAINPVDSKVIFAGGTSDLGSRNFLYRSEDSGQTWREIGNGLPYQYQMPLNDILIDPAEPKTIYIATYVDRGGIYKSIDNGETFNELIFIQPFFRPTSLAMDVEHHTIMYVGLMQAGTISEGIYKTIDGGESWRQTGLSNQDHEIYSVKADPIISGRVFAAGQHGCWRSDDYGDHWELVLPLSFAGPSDIDILGGVGSSIVFYTSQCNGLFRSTESGNPWTFTHLGNGVPCLNTDIVSVSGHTVFVGGITIRILYVSNNLGDSFIPGSKGLSANDVSCVATACVPSSTVYSGATACIGFFKTRDNGNVWFHNGQFFYDHIREIIVHPNNSDIAFVVYEESDNPWDGCSSISFDGGEHFQPFFPRPGIPEVTPFILAIDPVDTNIVYVAILSPQFFGEPHFYLSRNSGSSWEPIHSRGLGNIVSFYIDRTSVLYAGTTNGIYKSIDTGRTWTLSGLQGRTVTSLSQSYLPDGGIIVGTDNGVYRTTNGGITWSYVGLAGVAINDIFSGNLRESSPTQGIVWAATNQGVYEFVNGNFLPRNDGLGTLTVRDLALTKSNNVSIPPTLHAATPLGVYELPLVSINGNVPQGTSIGSTSTSENR
jgi:photosystem II stability/assembly factor-like uncharacterized protein